MENKIATLSELIAGLTEGTNIHICIHDISGFTLNEIFKIKTENSIHKSKICDVSKTTDKGMELCMTCKMLANNKAVKEKKMFIGTCPSGITEVVQPVIINSNVIGIIYVGNLVADEEYTIKKIKKTCKKTKVNENRMLNVLDSVQRLDNIQKYINIAKLIHSYIMLSYSYCGVSIKKDTHWAVTAITGYIQVYYNKDISISKFAKLYYMNEKYIGRLFKKQMKMSFNQYLNYVRINQSCRLLNKKDSNIIDISLSVGYNNVTYFNRIFKNIIGQTPTEYMKNNQSKIK